MKRLLLAVLLLAACGDDSDVTKWSVTLSDGPTECTGSMALAFEGDDFTGHWSCGALGGAVVGKVVTPFTGHTEMDVQTGSETAHVIVTKNNTQLSGVIDLAAGRSWFLATLQ